MPKRYSGFTLIELLVVIGILGILLTIVLVAINPARQFAQANDTKRTSDLNTILNAVHQYAADHKGKLPVAITATAQSISDTGADICAVISPTYVSLLPSDPTAANNGAAISDCTVAYDTEYQIVQDADGRVTVSAPNAQITIPITITR